MKFPAAFTEVLLWNQVTRKGWADKGMMVRLGSPGEINAKPGNYPLLVRKDDTFAPWTPSMDDLMADDWKLVPYEGPTTASAGGKTKKKNAKKRK